MIVWGFKTRSKSIARGEFSCPGCDDRRDFDYMEASRWFTLFWIPIFPYKTVGRFVRCNHCLGDFQESVLQTAPAA